MCELYRTFVKMFYQWTPLLCFFVMMALAQEDPRRMDLRAYADTSVNDFKLRLHQKLEELRLLKETMIEGNKKVLSSVASRHLKLLGKPLSVGCTVQREMSDEIVFGSTSRNALSLLRNFTFITLKDLPEERPSVSLQGFEYGEDIWLLAYHTNVRNLHFIKMYRMRSDKLLPYMKIMLPGASLVSSCESSRRVYIAIATTRATIPGFWILQWTGVQVEEVFPGKYEYIPKKNFQSLFIWQMAWKVYIAMRFVGEKRLWIRRYDAYSVDIRTVQFLEVEAHVIKHFEDGKMHFLVCASRSAVVVYWWSGSIFLQQQIKQFHKVVVDVAVHKIHKKVLIAVALVDEVVYLMQDESALYNEAGTIEFGPTVRLQSILLWKRSSLLYMMPISSKAQSLSAFELSLQTIVVVPQRDTGFEDCLQSVHENLGLRQEKIDLISLASEIVWQPSKQVVGLISLKVNGSITSKAKTKIRAFRLKTNISSTSTLEKLRKQLVNATTELRTSVNKSICKSKKQIIKSNLSFKNIVLSGKSVNLTISNHAHLNKVPTRRLPLALKKNGHQTISSNVSVSSARCRNVATEFLNKKEMKDYVLLKKSSQIVNGSYKFGNVTAKNIFVNSSIVNSLSIQNFVLISNTQKIRDSKTFKSVKAEQIETGGNINKINLKGLKDIVYLDSKNIESLLTFTSNLTVAGDLNLASVNNYEISQLFLNSVKRNVSEQIDGYKNFQSISINGNLNISAHVNGIVPSNLMTLNTNQMIQAPTNISNVVFQNLETDTVNNLYLTVQVLHKSKSAEIRGVKTFYQTLNVTNIIMKDDIAIDQFDPSKEISEIVTKNQVDGSTLETYFLDNSITVGSVIVLNDAEIHENSEELPLLDVLNNTWLNTTVQDISYLEVENITVSDVQVLKVNSITMEDLVPVDGDSIINSSKEFIDDVTMGTLNVKEEKYLNFTELRESDGKIILMGNVTIEIAQLEEDLTINGAINGMDLFMHVDEFQNTTGEFQFDEIRIQDMVAQVLNLQFLNNTNFMDYSERAVTQTKQIKVVNKNFHIIKGSEMDCSGCFNGMDPNKVVTVNTFQNISASLAFNSSLSFTKVDVNSFFDGVRLDDVVYVDEERNVSSKQFNGTVQSSHVYINKDINEINITDLGRNIFNTSRNNSIEYMIINSWMKTENLQLLGSSRIDGVDLESLVRLNETERLESLNASSVVAENVNVAGLINGCNWTSVLQNAIYLKKDVNQFVTAKTKINTLVVDGNLKLELVHGRPIDDVIALVKKSSEYKFEGGFIFENITVENVQTLNSVNGFNIDDFVNDTVRINVSQDIRGKKTFLEMSVAIATINFLRSNMTCGINISELIETFVSRTTGNQTILLQLLNGTLTADRIVAEKTLNSLKLPDDVVLTNKSESISNNVTINGTMNVTSNLEVFHDIDGVLMVKFLKERMTLNASEYATAELNFTDDAFVKGVTHIKGSINGIKIQDIVNTMQDLVVNGTINFTMPLTVKFNLTSANELLIQVLESKMLRSSRNETLKDLVKFSKLNTSSLICEKINNINILDFYNNTHSLTHDVEDELNNFTSYITRHMDGLENLRDSSEQPLSSLNYFELQHILDIGLVDRFLPFYEPGINGEKYELQVNQMIMWAKRNDSRHCRKTKSFVADVQKNSTLNVTKMKHGKIFPLSLKAERDSVLGFYVQAKHRCSEKQRRLSVKTFLLTDELINNTIKYPPNAILEEVRLAEMHDIYLIIAFARKGTEERIFLYKYDTDNHTWSCHQNFYGQDFTSLDWTEVQPSESSSFHAKSEFYLAVTGGTDNPGISVYQWDSSDDEFIFKTNITTSVSSYGLWINTDNIFCLLLAKEKTRMKKDYTWVNIYSEPLEVYSLVEDEMILNHTVSMRGVTFLEMFVLADEVFVLASSPHMGTLYVVQYRGYNGFEVIQEIPSPGITSTSIFTVGKHLYLAISSSTDPPRILKAAITVGRPGLD